MHLLRRGRKISNKAHWRPFVRKGMPKIGLVLRRSLVHIALLNRLTLYVHYNNINQTLPKIKYL